MCSGVSTKSKYSWACLMLARLMQRPAIQAQMNARVDRDIARMLTQQRDALLVIAQGIVDPPQLHLAKRGPR